MKTLLTMLATAAALIFTVMASGFVLDAAVLLSIGFGAGLSGMFVADYSRASRYNLETGPNPAPVHEAEIAAPAEDAAEFATLATVNTLLG
jgi:hypothetical protein